MALLTNTAKASILNAIFDGTGIYSSCEIALYSAVSDPIAGIGTELSGNGYARVSGGFAWRVSIVDDITVLTNLGDIIFPKATGSDWLEVTHLGIISPDGDVVAFIGLSYPVTSIIASTGTQITFFTGEVSIEIR